MYASSINMDLSAYIRVWYDNCAIDVFMVQHYKSFGYHTIYCCIEKDNTYSNLFDKFVLLLSAVVVTSVCVLVSRIFFTEE